MREWLERLVAHLPWYSVEVQTGKEARARQLRTRAWTVRVSAERILTDYQRAEQQRRTAQKGPR